jgi:hypothetical protein
MDRSAISVSEEELKKGIMRRMELMGLKLRWAMTLLISVTLCRTV